MKVKIYVQPSAKVSGYVGNYDGMPKIKLKSAAVDGAANKELIELLSGTLGVSKSLISITSGQTSRIKIIEINSTLTNSDILDKLCGKTY